ncbi:MAG: hypothetical protein U0163_15295 [Gemmatimonadaceae bacterium]
MVDFEVHSFSLIKHLLAQAYLSRIPTRTVDPHAEVKSAGTFIDAAPVRSSGPLAALVHAERESPFVFIAERLWLDYVNTDDVRRSARVDLLRDFESLDGGGWCLRSRTRIHHAASSPATTWCSRRRRRSACSSCVASAG